MVSGRAESVATTIGLTKKDLGGKAVRGQAKARPRGTVS